MASPVIPFWVKVTPDVLALTSMAVALPVMGSPASLAETLAWIERVLVIEVRVPLRSAMAVVLAVPPPVVTEITPSLLRDDTLAPASIRTPVT
ncbi:hypothetical protein D3C72_729640 [compost metagenome]